MRLMKIFFALAASAAIMSCSNNDNNTGNKPDPTDPYLNYDKTEYAASDEAFTNPERGWYIFNAFNFRTDGSLPDNVLNKAKILTYVGSGYTLIHTIYHMYDFVNKPLTQDFLDIFEANMNAIREGGAKCMLRFAYSNSYDQANDQPIANSDAPFDIFEGHIAQLKPLLQKHGDVLYVMEAGFIGAWGEWYYTSNYGFRPESTTEGYAPRRQVMDKLLDAVPKDRMICVRYPVAKLRMYGKEYADSVTLATAYNESTLSRIAAHNDCFLADANDTGTFFGATQRDYWHKETKYLIMGGETCGTSSYSKCPNTITQMENFHFSYLNRGYHQGVINGWKSEECYDEIDQRLGYRLRLNAAYFSKSIQAAKPLEVVLKIENIGFAAPMNPRDMEIVFVEKGSSSSPVRIKTDADPRYWFAGEEHDVKVSVNISALTSGKTYEVFLNLPDPKPALNDRWEYSIRLANEGVWDQATGYNKLREITIE